MRSSALWIMALCAVVLSQGVTAAHHESSRRLFAVPTAPSGQPLGASNITAATSGASFIEMRIYTAFTDKAKQYKDLTYDAGDLRCKVLPGFLGMFTVESGAADLNSFYSFYFYNSFDERDAARKAAPADPSWSSYVASILPLLKDTQSSILQLPGGAPTTAVQTALDMAHARAQGQQTAPAAAPGAPAYMVRTYKVSPKTATALLNNSPTLPTASQASGELLFYGSAAMGKTVGTMVELWRFHSAAAALSAQTDMQAAHQGSSSSLGTWKKALAAAVPQLPGGEDLDAAGEEVVILRPAKWSNWQ